MLGYPGPQPGGPPNPPKDTPPPNPLAAPPPLGPKFRGGGWWQGGGVILWRLRRAMGVIILEHRLHSAAYTHAFLCNVYPYTPFSPYFCYQFYLFGPPPQTVHLLPVPNLEWVVYEL